VEALHETLNVVQSVAIRDILWQILARSGQSFGPKFLKGKFGNFTLKVDRAKVNMDLR
jgi:hypothetical protein